MRRTLLFVIALPLAAALWFGKGEVVGAALGLIGPSAPDAPAYAVAAPGPAAGADEAAVESDLGALLKSASVEEGESVFRRCGACHKLDAERRALGPHLVGVVGRPIAAVDGFDYSDALLARGGVWTPAALSAYLADPRSWAPGTKKTLAPMDDPAERAAVVVYLNAVAPAPAPIFAGAGSD